MILRACLIAAMMLGSLYGQQKKRAAPPPQVATPQVFPLEVLKVQGNQRIASEKIVAVSGLKIGAPAVKTDFDNARNRLLATGAFESVGCEFKPAADNKGYDGTIEVVEVFQLYPYRFEELPVPEAALRAELRKQEPVLADQIPATKEVLDRYVAALQQAVGGSVKVTGKLYSDIPGQMTIIFRPNTPRMQVAEVRFAGNKVIPTELLAGTFAEVAIGTGFSESNMRILLDSSVRPLYEARGRVGVTFPKIETRQAPLVDGVIVTVTVDEGESFSLGELTFTGVAAAEVPEIQKIANLRPKDVVNFDDIKAGMDRVYEHYRGKGFLRATGHFERHVNDAEHTVSIQATVDPGPLFAMGKLEILGLDITTEPQIRKIWTLKAGAPFQPKYPDAFLKGIQDQQLFDNLAKTRSESNIDDKSHVVNVKLYFTSAEEDQRRKKNPPLLF